MLPRELTAIIEAAHRLNPRLAAFTSLLSPQDVALAFNEAPRGPLHGVPVAVKDVFCTTQLPTTAASRMLRDYTSPFDATVVKRLREAGALIHGKTNMDEFGMGSTNLNSYFGPALNPSGPHLAKVEDGEARVAGGSSGGSAAAVAAGLCRIALASDTGGSTRLPAAYCGVAGLKPSYGLLSRWGMIAYASSLDCVGIMAKEVGDVRTTLDVLSAFDEKDPTSAPQDARDRIAEHDDSLSPTWTSTNLSGLRIGVPAEYFLAELSPTVMPSFRRTLESLQAKGAILSSVSLPSTPLALSAYYVLASAEASSNLARFDGTRFGARAVEQEADPATRSALYAASRSQGFGKEVQKRLLLGTYALSAEAFDNYYLQAQRVRQLIRREFDSIFRLPSPLIPPSSSTTSNNAGVDLIIHPSSIGVAPRLRPSNTTTTPASSIASYTQDALNVPISLAGLPGLSVPAGVSAGEEDGEGKGWPVGVQIAGQWGSDKLVLKVGEAVEEGWR
ncbi:amidase signature domain-containing protein [Leucosporidium creatinivorum]|uniref:Glutamyl-tRNA(Gln) amidotransferase subunit A, mitochondrial n=1 Tax=Leucosporidium creatinivorum TaxID=106004 RepID=A0A1Y2FA77_9BASI|nr:amidase signature domain-containing protein [Leucosporidium creatinivorum]